MSDNSPTRLAGLDGLRAIAIALVFWMHLGVANMVSPALQPIYLGRQGVCLFFALSGYLITQILLRETSLWRFYWRRSLRIFPAFYAYLGTVGLCWAAGLYQLSPVCMLAAATYWMNWYSGVHDWPLQHTWSLSVEEQFYLVWPLALRFLGPRWGGLSLLAILAGWPLQRWLRTGRWGHPSAEDAMFSATYDSIFWGCLAALLVRAGWRPGWLAVPLVTFAALCFHPIWCPVPLIPMVRGGSLAWLVGWVAHHSSHPLTRCLDWAPLVWLGRRSYGIYLWHILYCDPRLVTWIPWPVAVGLALMSAELSFRWIESPLLRWRGRTFVLLQPGLKHQNRPQ